MIKHIDSIELLNQYRIELTYLFDSYAKSLKVKGFKKEVTGKKIWEWMLKNFMIPNSALIVYEVDGKLFFFTFVVADSEPDIFGNKSAFIKHTHIKKQNEGHKTIWNEGLEWVDKFREKHGCDYLYCESFRNRKPFMEKLKKSGFEPAHWTLYFEKKTTEV